MFCIRDFCKILLKVILNFYYMLQSHLMDSLKYLDPVKIYQMNLGTLNLTLFLQ